MPDHPGLEQVEDEAPCDPESGEEASSGCVFLDPEHAAQAGRRFDVVGLSLVTMGANATEHAQKLFAANEYKDYLHFHGFAVECAEGEGILMQQLPSCARSYITNFLNAFAMPSSSLISGRI